MRSEARVRSSELDEAMQTAPPPSSASASRTPSTPFSSCSNAAMMSSSQFVEEILRQLRAEIALRHATDRLGADAEETLARLFGAELEAIAAQHRARALQRDRLAVDDHAVAIEDDHLRPDRGALRLAQRAPPPSLSRIAARARRSASCRTSKARRLRGVQSGDLAARRLADAAEPRHRRHRLVERPPPRGDRAEHRRAEQDRLAGLRRGDAPSGRVGDDLPDQGAARRAAAGDDRVAGEAVALEQTDDLSESLRQAAQAGDVERHRALFVVAKVEADNRAARRRIGVGRAVAEKIGQDVQVAGEPRRLRGAAGAGDDFALQRVEGAGPPGDAGEGRAHPHQAIDRRAEGRLAAFDEPLAGRQRRIMRAPEGGNEARFVRDRHATGGRAENQRDAAARIGDFVAARGAQSRQRPRVRVDQPGADRDAGRQAERARRVGGEPAPQRRPWRDDFGADAREARPAERLEPDAGVELLRPAPLAREIEPLAGDRAGGAGERAGGAEGEEIGQVEKMAGGGEDARRMAGEPQQLGRLHFRRDGAADIAQRVVAAAVDLRRLFDRAMIHPDDDVAGGIAARPNRERFAGRIEDDQRTGRVEADAADRLRLHASRFDRRAHRGDGRRPDVGRGLFDNVAGLAPGGDHPPRIGEQLPTQSENARANAARSHVDADERLIHGRPRSQAGRQNFTCRRRAQAARRQGARRPSLYLHYYALYDLTYAMLLI